MKETEKSLERFIAHGKDECIIESQCKQCKNNLINKCKVFNEFPWKYRSAISKEICPKKE